jgi:uncharacterized protein YlxW (UPF0749 family)
MSTEHGDEDDAESTDAAETTESPESAESPETTKDTETTESTDPSDPPSGLTRRSRHRRAGALIGVLLALLGFAIAVQLKSNPVDKLNGLRDGDLITILDDQNSRAERLREQLAALQNTEQQLQASGNRDSVAEQQAQSQAQALQILLGTIGATGPGITVTITDPQHKLGAEDLLDVVEELRGAGAEAIQFGSVRVSTSTAFTAGGGGVVVDGQSLRAPYTVLAIGASQTLETALEIPGGVSATVRADGGTAQITQQESLTISVVRTVQDPRYAKPSGR